MLTRPDRATIVTLLAPPTVWALHFLTAYILAAIACAKGWDLGSVRLVIAAATGAALVFIALAARAAHRHTGFTADMPPHDDPTRGARMRQMGAATFLVAALSFVAVIFTSLPAVFIPDCR